VAGSGAVTVHLRSNSSRVKTGGCPRNLVDEGEADVAARLAVHTREGGLAALARSMDEHRRRVGGRLKQRNVREAGAGVIAHLRLIAGVDSGRLKGCGAAG